MSSLSGEARLAAIVRGSEDATVAAGVDGIITEYNAAAEHLYGLSAAETIGREAATLIPAERETEEQAIVDRVLAGEHVPCFPGERVRADGTCVPVSISVSALLDLDGTIAGFSTVARDDLRWRTGDATSQRLAAIVEGSDDAILAKDTHGIITDWNLAAERLYGYTRAEAVGQPVTFLVPPDRAGEEQWILSRVLDGQHIERFETERVHKDGRAVPVLLSVSPIHATTGEVVGASAIAHDITARRAADADRGLLAALVSGSADAIISFDPGGRILSWNNGATALLKISADTAIGRSVDDVIGPLGGDAQARRAILSRVFEHAEVMRYEAVRRTTTGDELTLNVSISPIHDAHGAIVAGCAIASDITAKRADDIIELRRLAAVVQSAQDTIVTLDLDGIVLSWNGAAERLYGVPTDDAVGRDVRDVVADSRGDRDELLERIARGERIVDEEAVRRSAGGETSTITITAFPITDERGTIVAAAFMVRDITEQRRTEEKLGHAQRIEAIGRLAGGIAHDFNNLMAVITGYSSIVQAHIGDGAGADELREVQRAARRASDLTGQLLDFSRQRTPAAVRLDLGEAVHGLLPMLERLIGEDIRVVALLGDVVPIVADHGQIEQVVVNLVLNARDAMPRGGTVTIETHTVDAPPTEAGGPSGLAAGRYACLTVTDTGTGIDPATAARLFEPFFTTKEVGKGTGLGLATVHGIVGQAGGDVRVYSEPGMGAAFKIYFPEADPQTVPSPDQPSQVGAEPEDRPVGHETVLLCEDEDALRSLIEHILGRAGYVVLSAASPAAALELIAKSEQPIDLLLTDVIMPGLTGPDLARRVTSAIGDVRTLYLSGYTADVLQDRGRLPLGLRSSGSRSTRRRCSRRSGRCSKAPCPSAMRPGPQPDGGHRGPRRD